MIPKEARLKLLDYQRADLANGKFVLFTNDYTPTADTVAADLTIAAWTSYANVTAGTWNAAHLVGTRAQTEPASNPTFVNGSSGSVTCYGWALLTSDLSKILIVQRKGATTIPAGESLVITPALTDTQE